MEIYGNIRQKVVIDPIDVLEKLKIRVIEERDWVFKDGDKYYHGFYQSAGSHSNESKREITKEDFEFIQNIENIIKYLRNY